MIEKLKPNEDKVFKTETGEYLTIPELGVPKPISDKINELVDAVNNQQIQLNNHECRLLDLQSQINEYDQEIDDCAATISKMEKVETSAKNVQDRMIGCTTLEIPESYNELHKADKKVRLPYMQNKRLRKALGVAQQALIKLANDAYDFDEHIYIDKILNQIERITKGGKNE